MNSNSVHCFFLIVDGWLVGWEIKVLFQHKTGYIRDKVLGKDLVPPGDG